MLLLCREASALHATAQLHGSSPLQYLSGFAYATTERQGGMGLHYWTDPPESGQHGLTLAMFDDQPWSWPVVHDAVMTGGVNRSACLSIAGAGRKAGPGGRAAIELLPLTLHGHACTAARPCFQPIHELARRRWWHIVAANCDADGAEASGTAVHLHFVNVGGWWRREFGVDQQGLLELLCITAPCFALFAAAWLSREWGAEGGGAAARGFIIALLLQTAQLLLWWAHYTRLATDGVGAPTALAAGTACGHLSCVALLCVVVVFASGFTLCPQRGEAGARIALRRQRLVLYGVFAALLPLHVVLPLWDGWLADPSAAVYPYDTPPGLALALLRVPVLMYFLATLCGTLRRVPDRAGFFAGYGALFAVYIASLPVLVLVAAVVSPWVRYRTVEIPQLLTAVTAQVAMGVVLWPGDGRQVTLARARGTTAPGAELDADSSGVGGELCSNDYEWPADAAESGGDDTRGGDVASP